MKGIIFRLLEKMVTTKLGPRAWDTLVERTPLQTPGGGYVGSETYPDADLLALVQTASDLTGHDAPDLVRAFGRFMFPDLVAIDPSFVRPGMTAKDFLMSVDRVVHVEVRKLQPGANLPRFVYEDPGPGRLAMLYYSDRQLCALAAGLIDGVAAYFGERIDHHQTECTLLGHSRCRFELTFTPEAD